MLGVMAKHLKEKRERRRDHARRTTERCDKDLPEVMKGPISFQLRTATPAISVDRNGQRSEKDQCLFVQGSDIA